MGILQKLFGRKNTKRINPELQEKLYAARVEKAAIALREARADAELREYERKVEKEKLALKLDEVRAERAEYDDENDEYDETEPESEHQTSFEDFIKLAGGAILKNSIGGNNARTDKRSEAQISDDRKQVVALRGSTGNTAEKDKPKALQQQIAEAENDE